MLPLGVGYFSLLVTLLSVSLAFIATPFLVWFGTVDNHWFVDSWWIDNQADLWWQVPLVCLAGFVLLFATLHLARGSGTCMASSPSTCW